MNMRRNWAALAGWLFALIGLVFCALSFVDPAFDWVNSIMISNAEPADSTSRMYALVMGAVLAGFGTTIARVATATDAGRRAVLRAMVDGVMTWYLIDTSGSLLHGSWQNAIFNTIGIAILLPALLKG